MNAIRWVIRGQGGHGGAVKGNSALVVDGYDRLAANLEESFVHYRE